MDRVTFAILSRSPNFKDWPSDAITHVLGEGNTSSFDAGTTVVTFGSSGSELFIVLEGRVEIQVPAPAGLSRGAEGAGSSGAALLTVDHRGPGQWFGEIACLLAQRKRTATVTASQSCKLAVVSQERFLDTLRRFPEASLPLLRQLAGRVEWHTTHLSGLIQPEEQRKKEKDSRSWWQRRADSVTRFFALPICIGIHVVWWGLWFLLPVMLDPSRRFPELWKWEWIKSHLTVDWLTNLVSLEAIVLSIAILVAARRKEEKDEARDATQFANTQVSVNQATEILERLVRLEERLGNSPNAAPGGAVLTPAPSGGPASP